jgi:hypothetical protein
MSEVMETAKRRDSPSVLLGGDECCDGFVKPG